MMRVVLAAEPNADRLATVKLRIPVLRALRRIGKPATSHEVMLLTGRGGMAAILAGLVADGLVTATPGTIHHHNRDHATTFYTLKDTTERHDARPVKEAARKDRHR